MDNLKITLIQSDIFWEDTDRNLEAFDKKLSEVKGLTDIIILPEMFSTGFLVNVEKCAETESGKTMQWLRQKAKEYNCVVTGGVLIKENGQYFNRLIWMQPDGTYQKYDKRHLFRFTGENKVFTKGQNSLITELKGWKIKPLICYDLRFPVWSKNKFTDGNYEYDCLIYAANWPEQRDVIWESLLTARAIENQSYVIGVNRVGADGKGNKYSGRSKVVAMDGETLYKAPLNQECIETVALSYSGLKEYRDRFTVGQDWDKFVIEQ